MFESDTMFNELDRRCAAVQLMHSTDPSYDKMTLRTATVMVFGVVSSEGHIIQPHIFEVSLKVNTKVYLDMLKSVVIPWCNQVAGGKTWVWQYSTIFFCVCY